MDSWTRGRYQSRSEIYHGGDEFDVDEALQPEFFCPFCAEEFDVVGFCCHVEEDHTIEFKRGLCPVCATMVGMDLVTHITVQHGNLLKVHRKRRVRRGGSSSISSLLRRELREGNLNALLGGSSSLVFSSRAEPDPLLSSFIRNSPLVEELPSVQPHSSAEACAVEENFAVDSLERNIQQPPPLSDQEQKERAQKCEFVQGLLMSTFLDDDL